MFFKKIMAVDLHSLADQVTDESSLIDFISALAGDWEDALAKEGISPTSPYGPGANLWENGTIEAFLRGASAWAVTSKNGMLYYTPPTNPWTRMAHILHMGKLYE
jgi:hypothetical protein